MSRRFFTDVMIRLIRLFENEPIDIHINSFSLFALNLVILLSGQKERFHKWFTLISSKLMMEEVNYSYHQMKIILYCLENRLIKINEEVVSQNLIDGIESGMYGEDEYEVISELIHYVSDYDDIEYLLKGSILEYISGSLQQDVLDEGVLSDVYDSESAILTDIDWYVENRLSKFNVFFDTNEISELVSEVDVDSIIQSNINSNESYDDHSDFNPQSEARNNNISQIHDLFDFD